MPQQASTLALGRERHAAEAAAVDIGNPVVPGQPLVEKGVVRPDQIEHAAILAHHAVEEELGLLPERLTQVVIEVREETRVRTDRLEIAQPQPLSGEVGREVERAPIGEHSARLLLELLRAAELAANRRVEQFIVGDAAPQEERQPGCQLEIADSVGAAGGDFLRIGFPRGTGTPD